MTEYKFLFDNQLIAELENIIKHSKNTLLLISPYIDLDKRIQDALREKLTKHDCEIKVLFGKNEDNLYKSIKKDSLNFLKQFPNIEIRYNDRLHAKFYLNDFNFILTSINLYDYSLAKNIETGVLFNYASTGLIGKVFNGADSLINHGVGKVKHDFLGLEQDSVDPIEKFYTIFNNSDLKYQTKPIIEDESGVKGIFGGKKLCGFNVIEDNLKEISINNSIQYSEPKSQNNINQPIVANKEHQEFSQGKLQSASQLSRIFNVPQSDIINLMQKTGLVDGDKITSNGISKGLAMKNYMGKNYIAYPDNLPEFNKFKS